MSQKNARERVDSPKKKPTASHLLDHYPNAKEEILSFGSMMTKHSTAHELFEWFTFI